MEYRRGPAALAAWLLSSNEDPLGQQRTDGRTVATGGMWVALSTALVRILTFTQSVVIARLLFPQDLGLMAIASLSIGTMNIITQFGFDTALIQRRGLDARAADSAWVLSAVRGIGLSVFLVAAAPAIGSFFREDRAVDLIRALAVSVCVEGFANSYLVLLRRNLDFKRQTWFTVAVQCASVSTTIVLTFVLQNVWGLVAGRVVAACVRVLGSYVVVPERPRFRIDRQVCRELLSFGRHIIGINTLSFIHTQVDDAFVGRVLGKTAMGFYTLAYAISNFVGTAVSQILRQLTLPVFANLRDAPQLRAIAFERALRWSCIAVLPATGATILFAEPAVRIIYGERWLLIVPVVQILCLFGMTRAITTTLGSLLVAIGQPHRVERTIAFQVLIVLLALYPMGTRWGIAGVAVAVTSANALGACALIREVVQSIQVPPGTWLRAFQWPVLGTAAASGVCYLAIQVTPRQPAWIGAPLLIVGTAVYVLVVLRDRSTREELAQILRSFKRAG